jgi:preprotein translocase subunit SecA
LRRAAEALRQAAVERALTPDEVTLACGLVREAARRAHGTPHHAHQLMAGCRLDAGRAIEFDTGEGKTLTALVVAFLWGLRGAGCHVLTANDYLAARDAEHARPVLERLGLTVAALDQRATPEQRRQAYQADVTYLTVTQAGFDWLRERVAARDAPRTARERIQRPLAAVVVDEADLVLLDEARTPLLLAVAEPISAVLAEQCRWARALSRRLNPERDYRLDRPGKRATLTEVGCREVLLAPQPRPLAGLDHEAIYRLVERALEAEFLFQRDHDYLVRDGKVAIIAPTTGRVLEGRQWQNGLQPAIETKEAVAYSPRTSSRGAVTIQALINRYPRRCGMSGTLRTDREELRRIYGLRVERIAPRVPAQRRDLPPRVFTTRAAKWRAIVDSLKAMRAQDRPVLVGTPSIEASQELAACLMDGGLPFELLTAKDPAREAEIIARAGLPGQLTIATNMAGRGTDIRIDDAVRQRGGLHVIVAGWQASRRTDRQLMGRTARQGDPGSTQAFLSYEDELPRLGDPVTTTRWRDHVGSSRTGELSYGHVARFRRWQIALERLHARQRLELHAQHLADTAWLTELGLDPYLEPLDPAA